jgi:hypothetical protein
LTTTTISYDIEPYLSQVAVFLTELQEVNRTGQLSIARIFQILPLRVWSPYNGRSLLEKRGGGSFKRVDTVFENNASSFDVITFKDDQLGFIKVKFPAAISVSLLVGADGSVTVTSVNADITIDCKQFNNLNQVSPPLKFDAFVVKPDGMEW